MLLTSTIPLIPVLIFYRSCPQRSVQAGIPLRSKGTIKSLSSNNALFFAIMLRTMRKGIQMKLKKIEI
jgi:hypothetical protein